MGFGRAAGGWRAITISSGGPFSGGTVDSSGTYRAQYGQGSIAITSAGVITYQKSISGGTGGRQANGSFDSSGNFYAIYTLNTNNSTVKFNSAGAISWQGYPNQGTNILRQAVYPSNGNQYWGYNIISASQNYIMKASTAGVLQWTRQLTQSGRWWLYPSLCLDSSENLFAYFSIQQSSGGFTHGLWLAKYTANGTIQWQRTITVGNNRTTPNSETNTNIATDGTNAYLVHSSQSTGNTNVLAKFDGNGTNSWQRSMTGATQVWFHSVVADSSGSSYVALSNGNTTAYILKYNTNGVLQWQRSLTGLGTFYGSSGSLNIDPTGTFLYIAGTSNIVRVRTDGSGTGTIYSGCVYSVSTHITDAAYSSILWETGTATDATFSSSVATSNFTEGNTAFTLTVQA